jgi:oligoendopeptidase F
MTTLPFAKLQPFATRRFLPAELELGDWETIEPWFDRLAAQASTCETAAQLEEWLLDWSELQAAGQEETARRYIAMTCDTEDKMAENAHLEWVKRILPRLKSRSFEMAQLFIAHPARPALPADRYLILNRLLETEVRLFRDKNLPLETADVEIRQRYQKRCGAQSVAFRGGEKTMSQLVGLLKDPDRGLREEAWTAQARRRLEDTKACDADFDELVRLRTLIATQAGYANYRDYAFRLYNRFDYTAETCLELHAAIESEVMPVVRELHEKRRQQLQVPVLRPWDLAVDPRSPTPLKSFSSTDELIEKTTRIFAALDPELGANFQLLRDHRMLDLADRKGKAPGGYYYPLGETRLSFIFMNAVGTTRDVSVLLHEGGHALHDFAARTENLHWYRQAPFEFCEMAAMSMELLGSDHFAQFYPPDDARRAQRDLLEGILKSLPWMAQIDAFQHSIYTNPGYSASERTACWVGLMRRFGDPVEWTGFEEVHDTLWHRLPHPFVYPFYYIEYGLAQLGALQVWRNASMNKVAALTAYKSALALGASRPLPALFDAAGATFAFSAAEIRPLIKCVKDQLAGLSD